eukprot:9494721-Pyramimonas_sp.AAC.1
MLVGTPGGHERRAAPSQVGWHSLGTWVKVSKRRLDGAQQHNGVPDVVIGICPMLSLWLHERNNV